MRQAEEGQRSTMNFWNSSTGRIRYRSQDGHLCADFYGEERQEGSPYHRNGAVTVPFSSLLSHLGGWSDNAGGWTEKEVLQECNGADRAYGYCIG